jgi:hypothetical protein
MDKPPYSPGSAVTPAGLNPLETAILHTIAYTDVFDYPLTAVEVHRYLMGIPAAATKVRTVLSNGRLLPERLARCGDFFTLPGREEIVDTRRRRAVYARHLWPWAIYYGRLVGALPFVRMVAVTGSLAVDNVEPGADIDYLIVTENGRLWLCRALVILVVRLAARRGVILCPNYFLAERALRVRPRNLYNARELTQMTPLVGWDIYQRLRRANSWTADFLPNAADIPPGPFGREPRPSLDYPWSRRLGEMVLRTRIGGHLEEWEMRRKIDKFSRQRQAAPPHTWPDETAFSPDWCKGHFDNHGWRIMAAFQQRLKGMEWVAMNDERPATGDE